LVYKRLAHPVRQRHHPHYLSHRLHRLYVGCDRFEYATHALVYPLSGIPATWRDETWLSSRCGCDDKSVVSACLVYPRMPIRPKHLISVDTGPLGIGGSARVVYPHPAARRTALVVEYARVPD
jgi:hypothetical protein